MHDALLKYVLHSRDEMHLLLVNLQVALEELGLPCYHMAECFKHPDHPQQWSRAADGEQGTQSCACHAMAHNVVHLCGYSCLLLESAIACMQLMRNITCCYWL
jgi:hypothetical protein